MLPKTRKERLVDLGKSEQPILEAKNTVITEERIKELLQYVTKGEVLASAWQPLLYNLLIVQAEISFPVGKQEGRKEVVKWVDENWLDSSNLRQWRAKLKEWEID